MKATKRAWLADSKISAIRINLKGKQMEERSNPDSLGVESDPTPPPPLNCTTVEFLQKIHSPGSVLHFFVKEVYFEKNRHLVGYYDWDHLEKLSHDVQAYYGKATGVFYGLNPVHPNCLKRAQNRLESVGKAQPPKDCDILQRSILFIDIDPLFRLHNSPAFYFDKEVTYFFAAFLEDRLKKLGWPNPIMVDSGNGHHLLYKIALPVKEKGLVSACLKTMKTLYGTPEARIDTKVFDARRLAKLPGTMACKGIASEECPHRKCSVMRLPNKFETVPNVLLEEMAIKIESKIPHGPVGEFKKIHFDNPTEVISKARAYLSRMPPAIEGQNGRNQFLNAACRMVDDFALSREQAIPLLEEYNKRCVPPFESRGFEDKIRSALAKVALRGGPSGSALFKKEKIEQPELKKTESRFLGFIPDFGLQHKPNVLRAIDSKGTTSQNWLVHWLFWKIFRSPIQVPDIILRQLHWGRNYDRNWKNRLFNFEKKRGNVPTVTQECLRNNCILYGANKKHEHYVYNVDKKSFLFQNFNRTPFENFRDYNFDVFNPEFKTKREEFQKKGELFYVYWPALILGSSRKVGWSWSQQRLVVGLVFELTRTARRLGADIVGEVIRGAKVHNSKKLTQNKVNCPLLHPDKEYVVFGGNGNRAGLGYRLAGKTGNGWVFRAGFLDAPEVGLSKRREYLKTFLETLESLKDDLGLVPAALGHGEWKSMDQLMDATRSENGMKWLEECTLRVFAPADWRLRWRQFFSDKLGFDWIPSNPNDLKPGTEETKPRNPEAITTANQVMKWMKANGITQSQLALEISSIGGAKCSVRRIQRHLSGKSNTSSFYEAVEKIRVTRMATPVITPDGGTGH